MLVDDPSSLPFRLPKENNEWLLDEEALSIGGSSVGRRKALILKGLEFSLRLCSETRADVSNLVCLRKHERNELGGQEPPLGAMQKKSCTWEDEDMDVGTTWWVTGFPLWGQRGRAAPYCSWVEWSREAGGYGVTQREARTSMSGKVRQDDRAAVCGRGIRQPRPQLGGRDGASLLLVLGKG